MADGKTESFESVFGADPGSIAEETLSPDERLAAEEQAQPAEPEAEAPKDEPEADGTPETTDEADDGGQADEKPAEDTLPEFMTPEYLERNPDAADNWRALKAQAKDFKTGLKQAQEFLGQRDAEIKAIRAEMEQLRAAQAAPAQAPAPMPDPVENPAAYAGQIQQQVAAEVASLRFDMSEQAAIREHGKTKVDEAFARYSAAVQSEPALAAMVQSAPDPYAAMVAEMDRRALLAEMGDDPVAYRNRLEAEALEKARAQLAAETEAEKTAAVEAALSQRSRIPTSIATAPGAGRSASNGADFTPAPAGAVFGDSPLNQ